MGLGAWGADINELMGILRVVRLEGTSSPLATGEESEKLAQKNRTIEYLIGQLIKAEETVQHEFGGPGPNDDFDALKVLYSEGKVIKDLWGGSCYCIIQEDGRYYIVPADRRDEASEVLEAIEAYWTADRWNEPHPGPAEPPEWMHEFKNPAHLTFKDPRLE